MSRIAAQIVGVTGYTGGELYRLLLGHPQVDVVSITAKSKVSEPISKFFPNFQGISDMKVEPTEEASLEGLDVVFLSTPHGVAMDLAEKYLNQGIKVIDISGDHRLRDPKVFQAWYRMEHRSPQLLPKVVYGMPELFRRDIRQAELVSNPGCYPTSAILAAAPLLKHSLVEPHTLVFDAKSGVSGAGRKPGPMFHLPECANNFSAYKIAAHQHTPEIEQALGDLAGESLQVSFTTHLLPISRGILTTLYAELSQDSDLDELRQAYRDFYGQEPFIRLRESENKISLNTVVGSNYCDIGVFLDDRLNRVIVVSVIDNLLKGAAGQAVQNLNILFDLDEGLGLRQPGWLI